MIRWLLWTLLAVLLLVAVLGLGAFLHPGVNRYLAVELAARVPALSVQGISGSLLGELCVEQIGYDHPRVTVTADDVCVAVDLWRSLDFLAVSIDSLTIGSLRLTTRPDEGAEPSEPEGDLALPVVLEIDRAAIGLLEIDGVVLADIQSSVQLSNRDLASRSAFLWNERRLQLATSGPWRALQGSLSTDDLAVSGTVDLTAGELPYRLEASAARLDLEPYLDRPVLLEELALVASGDLAGYRFEGRTLVSDPLATGRLEAAASGGWEGLELTRARLEAGRVPGLDLTIESLATSGSLAWRDGVRLVLTETFATGSRGPASLEARAARVIVDTERLALEGVVLDLADGESAAAEAVASVASVAVDGQVGFDGLLDLALDGSGIPLALIDGRLSGLAASDMRVRGTLDQPLLKGTFELDSLSYQDSPAALVRGIIDGGLDAGELEFRAEALEAGLDARLSYRQESGQLDLSIHAAELELEDSPAGRIHSSIQGATHVVLRDGGLSVAQTCLEVLTPDQPQVTTVTVCGEGSYPEGPIRFEVPRWRFAPWTIPDSRVTLTGEVDALVALTGLEPLDGRVSLRLAELMAHHADVEPLQLGAVDIEALLAAGAATLTLSSPPDQGLELNGRLQTDLTGPLAQAPVDGEVSLSLNGIWAAEAALPMDVAYELQEIRGILEAQARVSGTLGEPVPQGRLALVDGGWDVIALNTRFSEVGLEADISGLDGIAFRGGAKVGEGSLSTRGYLDLGDNPVLTTRFDLDEALVVDLLDYSAVVSGGLSFEMTDERLALDGDLELPVALLRIADLPETAVTTSEDEVLVGEDGAGAHQQVRQTDLRLVLGDRVELDAFGLNTRLTGNLRLRESPGRPQELTGVISLKEGVFEAYGQALEVERGVLSFTGPVDDPGVDVVATRMVTYAERDYRISLLITGTAQNLTTTVRSEPSLPEDDALALLITGRTFSQISSAEQTNVYGAAVSLGLFGASRITRNMASTLGLEEIIVDQDAEGNMEVGAAVRLNPDLYLRYTYGVFSRLGGVLLRYRLTSRFSVQAKTGDAHSIELRYGVD